MMKKSLKHVAAIVLLVGFAVFALGSGSSPSSSGGSYSGGGGGSSSSSGGCPKSNLCVWVVPREGGSWRYEVCSRSSCRVQTHNEGGDTTPGTVVKCDCP